MGGGGNALYLAANGYQVTGVDSEAAAVAECRRRAAAANLQVRAVEQDAGEFRIAKSQYAVIVAGSLFRFIEKSAAAKLVNRVGSGLKRGGLFLCSVFTVDDPSYKVLKRKCRETKPGMLVDNSGRAYTYYGYGELLDLCRELRPIYYREYDFYDTLHVPGHWHGVAELVGKKS
jgi:cyclopropane fatty-acyl-phospholipid synthase-like methyltransferase